MAQQSKFYKLFVSQTIINLEKITIYPPNTAPAGLIHTANSIRYGTLVFDDQRAQFLNFGDYEPLVQAQTEYGEFEANAKKNAFMFGQKVAPKTFIGGLICGLLEKFRCGCNDNTTPPAPSEPMVKTNPNGQEPPTDTQD